MAVKREVVIWTPNNERDPFLLKADYVTFYTKKEPDLTYTPTGAKTLAVNLDNCIAVMITEVE